MEARKGQRIGRAVVRSQPVVVIVAAQACTAHLYSISKRLDGDGVVDNPEVVVAINDVPAVPYGDDTSVVLPFDREFPIHLEEGDLLYAVSPGESMLTFSIIPR